MSFFRKKKAEVVGGEKDRSQELLENVLVWGGVFLLVFFLGVVLLDYYIFYRVNYEKQIVPEAPAGKSPLSFDEINRLNQKLDQRQQRFEEILKAQ